MELRISTSFFDRDSIFGMWCGRACRRTCLVESDHHTIFSKLVIFFFE